MTILVTSLLRYIYSKLYWDFITDLIASSFIDIHRLYVYHLPYFRAASALHYSALLWPTNASHESLHYVPPITHHLIQHACLSVYIHMYLSTSTRLSDLYWSMCYALLMIVLSSALHPVCHNNHTNFDSSYRILVVYPFTSHALCWLVSYSFRIQYTQSISHILSVVYSIS